MSKLSPAKAKVATGDNRHPLDPLSEAEITSACAILKKQKKLSASTRFAFVQLEEPAKADVLAWTPGKPMSRSAAATVFDTKTGAVHIGVVDLQKKDVSSWLEHPARQYPYGQPPVIIEEFFKVGDIVKRDAGWRKAMKRRGLSDKDIELVQVDPF
jgi:primary-amine oxidase